MRIGRQLVCLTLILALGSSSAWSQASAEAKNAAKIRAKIERIFDSGGRAKLELKDGRRVQGQLVELEAERFVLAYGGRSETHSYSDVNKVGRIGPSPDTRKWVALGVLGGLLGLGFLAASQTR
jgi:hypothetical protein